VERWPELAEDYGSTDEGHRAHLEENLRRTPPSAHR
jgi:hypothetical protein